MNKSIVLLLALTVGITINGQTRYELSASTCTASSGDNSPWSFSNGFSISETVGKTYQTGNNNGIKYSAGVQYTISIPSGVTIYYAKFTGYDNYAEVDAYLSEVAGTTYSSTDYVFPQKDSSGNATTATQSISFADGVSSSLTFTPAGKQVVLVITLYDYDPTSSTEDTGAENFVYPTSSSQMETLDRGLVAMKRQSGSGRFLSWRLLGTEDPLTTTFDILRGGDTIATNVNATNYVDTKFALTNNEYQVIAKHNGVESDKSDIVTDWGNYNYTILQMASAPTAETDGVTYTPNDCSVGDVDGDGKYELFVKWDPSNSKDNSQSGKTDPVYIDCYKLDGTHLWRINLGHNIRAGAHYTQFLVWDFDGDGKAEMMCKTAPGSTDSEGDYVNQAATDEEIKSYDNTTDYRTDGGRINSGQEYLTVFNGLTGKAIHTVFYRPNRNGGVGGDAAGTMNWDTRSGKSDYGSYGNRGERYLATVAYLSGTDKKPSAVFTRGYYTYAYLWAVDFSGDTLSTRWLHASNSKTSYKLTDADGATVTYTPGSRTYTGSGGSSSNTMFGNGNHNLSCGDVDGDGCDEIIWGSAACDNDGKLLYAVGYGHGDAIHFGDLDPDRSGLELFDIHEDSPYGWDLHDAATGEIIYSGTASDDTGRGLCADVLGDYRGAELWSAYDRTPRNAQTGETVSSLKPSENFRIFWDDDLQEELFDGSYSSSDAKAYPKITKVGTSSITTLVDLSSGYCGAQTCNTTKATPCLQADILGDWREELVCWNYDDPTQLIILSSNIPTDYMVPTLMHDHIYRLGVAWQNVAYNQPPHLGYYLPDYIEHLQLTTGIRETRQDIAGNNNNGALYDLSGRRVKDTAKPGIYIQGGKKIIIR